MTIFVYFQYCIYTFIGRGQKFAYIIYEWPPKDNFVIDERSGAVSVSKDAILDIQENGELYTIQVQALDRGKPFGQSSEATISVQIEDVNDKSPMCQKDSFTMYVLESIPVGKYFLYFSPKDECGQINSL